MRSYHKYQQREMASDEGFFNPILKIAVCGYLFLRLVEFLATIMINKM